MNHLPEEVHEALLKDHLLKLAARNHIFIGIDPAAPATPEFKERCKRLSNPVPTTAFDVFADDHQSLGIHP